MRLATTTCNIWREVLVRADMKDEFTCSPPFWLGIAYRMIWVVAALTGYLSAWSQPDLSRSLPPLPEGYWLQVEEVVQHTEGELAGMTTYRVYLNCLSPYDYLSSCSGDNENPFLLTSTVSPAWFNSPMATGWNAGGINPALLGFFPEVAFDSFLTIGSANAIENSQGQPSSLWGQVDATLEFDEDGPGDNVAVDDTQGGAWYVPFPGLGAYGSHPAFAGDDLRILVAQLTTAGHLTGQIQVQVFREGNQAQELRSLLTIVTDPVFGCTQPEAFNYDPVATADDGECNLQCSTGTRFDVPTGQCELAAWLGDVGDFGTLDPCHLDLDGSGAMDITDWNRILVVLGEDPGLPLSNCGAGTFYDEDLGHCFAAPSNVGEGNGWNNLHPRFFDLNGDGALDVVDFVNLLSVFGKVCPN